MLTRKQYELLMFIHERLQDTGVSPSFDEMKESLGLKSKSGVHRLITGLEERGFVRRLPHRARALEIVRLPENAEPGESPVKNRKIEALRTNFTGSAPIQPRVAANTVQLALYGKIAAGTPIEALRDHSVMVDVPAGLLGKGNHYALEVDGDSMIEAGILDGDTVLIEQTDIADNGDIVVALVEGSEVTLKRLRRKGESVALEPANKNYETRIYGPDQVQVQGRLVGLLRKY